MRKFTVILNTLIGAIESKLLTNYTKCKSRNKRSICEICRFVKFFVIIVAKFKNLIMAILLQQIKVNCFSTVTKVIIKMPFYHSFCLEQQEYLTKFIETMCGDFYGMFRMITERIQLLVEQRLFISTEF